MTIFYTPDIEGEKYILSAEESRHAVQVLRLCAGDRVQLIDGRGSLYEAIVEEPSQRGCVVRVVSVEREYGKRLGYLHIAIAPTKNIDRFEWFLEKATEIGIERITPLLTDHSERKIIKDDRCEKVILAAAKQSLKAYLPDCDSLEKFDDFIKRDFGGAHRYIAHCNNDFPRREFKDCDRRECIVMIGAEGDFSPKEIDRAYQAGFTGISLGTARLRTETAGVVAAVVAGV
ncbi:Ribosomal RNA small subunit methyltransferase E [Mucinivorans hirudinis]|uniref:Ribosomal RNA small subunit methyltransferase E n=1 Tax=Mucinivorans hirudinis TaxID=1433126 RepID=A0A060R8B4_9BACT|nr:Ribosomal RNA small subunit methyltransferase E [Mucinivorans hirudinis]